MNEKSNYGIRKWYVDELIENMEEERKRIEIEFKSNTDKDITDNNNILKYVEIEKLNKTSLKERFEKTGDLNIELIIKYRSIKDKLSKIKGFKESIKTEKHTKMYEGEIVSEWESYSISPTFALRNDGTVTVSKPSFPFTIEQIKNIICFEHAIIFNNLTEILTFLRKYKNVIKYGSTSKFLIINTTLYVSIFEMEDFFPYDFSTEEEENEAKELIEEFKKEYVYKIKPDIEKKIEFTIEKDTKTANIKEKTDKKVEDVVDIKGQINHVADTMVKFNSMIDKLNAEKVDNMKKEEKKHYVSKMGDIELNYTKKTVLVNSFNIAELFFQSANTDELKANVFNLLNGLTPTWSNIDNFNFAIDGLNITASLDVEMIDTEEKYILSLEDGKLKITAI
jgi:hypothetical protein